MKLLYKNIQIEQNVNEQLSNDSIRRNHIAHLENEVKMETVIPINVEEKISECHLFTACGRRAEDMRLPRPQSRIVGGSESPPGR